MTEINKKFASFTSLDIPPIESLRIPINTLSTEDIFSKHEDDCPAIKVCKAVKEECRKGATAYINSRCSGAEVHSVLTKYNNQSFTFNGNVSQFAQGDGNQLTIQNQLPQELIEELTKLLNSPETDKPGWISWFNKAATFIGDLGTITAIISNL